MLDVELKLGDALDHHTHGRQIPRDVGVTVISEMITDECQL